MIDWQPVETAPKDGRKVLLLDDEHTISIAEWSDDGYGFPWMECLGRAKADIFTHWMPLPALPKEEK